MLDLIRNFFDSDVFIPHGHCYLWQPGLVWLHGLSDALIALAYYSIPIMLFYFVRKREDLPFIWIFILFATFITACGTTHLMDVWTLWHPAYWLSGAIKAITAWVSVGTALILFPLIPHALALPSSTQLEAANRELEKEIKERKLVEETLRHNKARYRAIVDDQTELITRFLPDGTLVFVNAAYCRYFGLIRDEIVGSRYHPLIWPDDQEQVDRAVASMNIDNPVVTIENRVFVQGQIRWTQWINRALFDAQGQIIEFQAVGHDIHDRKQAEEQLQASLREKEVLLKEIHHRVKNNLQIVYSLLRLQRRRLRDQQMASYLLESQNRIESIALIHEKLYRSKDLARINFADYIPSLVSNLFSSYNVSHNNITLKTEIEPITLNIDQAIPCGLIINELVSNSLKYAFPDAQEGQLSVEFRAEPQRTELVLVVRDNGVGISQPIDFQNPKTLGLQLVQDFVIQLKGTIQTNLQMGTEFWITFPGGAL